MKQQLLTLIFGLIYLWSFSQVANQPSNLEICDDDNDGFSQFDISVLNSQILGNQDSETFTLTYHETQSDAINGTNAITSPYSNITQSVQILYARVEDNTTLNADTTSFELIVNPLPIFSIDDISVCQGDSVVVDTGLNPLEHTFIWSTGEETSSGITITQEGQYWVAATNFLGCTYETFFNVTFDGLLSFNQPSPMVSCDFEGFGYAEFDLSQATPEIIGSQTDVAVTYYASQEEAEQGITSIVDAFPYINIVPYNQVLYFRVDSNLSDCFAISVLELIVSGVAQLPTITDYVICDEDQNGFEEFVLQSKNDEVLATQNNFEVNVSYHLSEADAFNQTNQLPNLFSNTTNPQTIYVAVSDFNFCSTQVESFNLVADQTCLPCQNITASIDSTSPEVNASGVVVAQQLDVISFTGSATFSDNDTDATYSWDFGNNNSATGTAATQQYTEVGNYTVTLTVTDNNPEGCSESTTIPVQILGANLVVDQFQFTVEDLVQNVLIGNECSQISNITYSTGSVLNGAQPNGIGYFLYEGNDFPFSEGLLLSTGEASDAAGPNDSNVSSGTSAWPGDSDLDNQLGLQSNNATSIEFDFVPVVNQINFDFLMASEEYNGGSFECTFSDAFAFLLTDALGNTSNLALIPGTDLPITVTNIHEANGSCDAANADFFGGYTPQGAGPTAYNGRTVSFTAQANVNIGETYHIKLVIADDGDAAFDSAVFLKAGSFDIGGICDDIGLIGMRAFTDSNTNGSYDTNESRFSNGSFTYEKNNDGVVNVVNSSTGSFTIVSTNETDTYDVTFAVNDEYTNCYTQNVATFDDVNVAFGEIAQVDFPIIDNLTCEDLAVYLINPFASPRPGFEHTNFLILENLSGATIASGSVEFMLDDDLVISNTTLSNSNMTLTTTATGFTLDFTNFVAGQSESVNITLLCPATVNLQDIVTNIATYTTATNDTFADNNVSTLSELVIGSYDPNDKMESHGKDIIYDDFVVSDEYLYYTIRFQNVGTAEAINVRIEDILDAQLDESTFQMLRSSHDYVVTRTANTLEWNFDNINLPAEQNDAEESNGYVYFKIKPNTGYAVGDVIENSAAIYFDFNEPIITNIYQSEFVETLSVATFEAANFTLFPNPAKGKVIIQLANSNFESGNINVYDIQGKMIVKDIKFQEQTSTLDISNLESGLYFIELTTGNASTVQKLIVN